MEQIGFAALFLLISDQAVQLPLDGNQLLVNFIIVLIFGSILGIVIQNSLVVGRIEQAHRVVLTIDINQSAAQFPQDGRSGRHSIDAADTLALGGNLTGQKQFFAALIPCFFQTVLDSSRNFLKSGPNHGFGSARPHQFT